MISILTLFIVITKVLAKYSSSKLLG